MYSGEATFAQFPTVLLVQVLKSELEHFARAVEIFDSRLELGPGQKEHLSEARIAQVPHARLVHFSAGREVPLTSLPFGHTQNGVDGGPTGQEPVQHFSSLSPVFESLQKFDVGRPGPFSWRPGHPLLVNEIGARVVAEGLFHGDVLVPELVRARQQIRGAFPNVARVVNELVFHFDFGIL